MGRDIMVSARAAYATHLGCALQEHCVVRLLGVSLRAWAGSHSGIDGRKDCDFGADQPAIEEPVAPGAGMSGAIAAADGNIAASAIAADPSHFGGMLINERIIALESVGTRMRSRNSRIGRHEDGQRIAADHAFAYPVTTAAG